MKSKGLVRIFGVLFSVGALGVTGCASSGNKSRTVTREERARLYVEVANGAIMEGDATGALMSLMDAESLGVPLPELHHSRAIAYYMKKDLDAAILSARKAVEMKPSYSDANATLGKLLMDKAKFHEAEIYLLRAARDPVYRDAFKARTSLGILYYKNGEFTQAEAQFGMAIEQEPVNACAAYFYRGELRIHQSKFMDAIRDYEKATQKFCGKYGEAHMALAKAYARAKLYDKARRKFLEVKDIFSNSELSDQAMENLRYLP